MNKTLLSTREEIQLAMHMSWAAAILDMPSCDRHYWKMVQEWRLVVAGQTTDDEKRSECMAILHCYTERLAQARIGQPNAPLRFCADMIVLARQLRPHRPFDRLGKLAIRPGFETVLSWLQARNALASPR